MPRCLILAAEHSPMTSVIGPLEILTLAQRLTGRRDWQFEVVADAALATQGGLTLQGTRPFCDSDSPDILIIAALGDPRRNPTPLSTASLQRIRQLAEQGCHLVSICSGAWALAESGLLNGLNATSHWSLSDWLAEHFPAVHWHTDAMLIRNNSIWCGGGGSAWQDVTLSLVQHYFGDAIARHTAQLVLIDRDRDDQRRYRGFIPARQHQDHLIHQVQDWLDRHACEPFVVADLAAQVHLSERQFKRRFSAAVKLPPREYVQSLRMEQAKHLLTTSQQQVDSIARQCGYDDVRFFRRLFRRSSGLTPLAYRAKVSSAG